MKFEQETRGARLCNWRRTMLVSATVIGLSALSASDIPVVGSSEAQAIIGRPATPYSVAGVARRTVRRNM